MRQSTIRGCIGRRTDPREAWCSHCAWMGPAMDAEHGYRPTAEPGDVEPVDTCPECGSEIELVNS